MLQAAAAARAEMGAGRLGAVGAGFEHLRGAYPAITAPGQRCRADALARQRERHVGRAPVRKTSHAVAVEADALDDYVLWD